MAATTTRAAILDLAQELAQTRGFNGFSFKDLAAGVGIRPASVHHHFPTKEALGREVMARYRTEFRAELERIATAKSSARTKLEKFAAIFAATLRRGNRLCLCGMLATEYATLPASMQREVQGFIEDTEGWLARVLDDGRRQGALAYEGTPATVARAFLATMEGAMIAARTFGDEARLSRTVAWVLHTIEGMHVTKQGRSAP